jgi:hypothetical protein
VSEGGGAPEITPEMLLAGVRAYQAWNYEKEEIEGLVASVFYEMMKARP